MKNKTIIHQFDPVIYPRYLWVIIGKIDLPAIKERFEIEKSLLRDIEDNGEKCSGITIKASEIDTRNQGVIVVIKRSSLNTSVIAHESVHCADYMFDEVGAYSQHFNDTNEPYAYLVGWIANCIDKVRRGKE